MNLPVWTQLLKTRFSEAPKSLVSDTDFLIRSQWLWLYTESRELHHQRFQLLSAGTSTTSVDEGERMWQEILENVWQSTDSTHDTVAFTIWLVAYWCVVRTFQSVPMRKSLSDVRILSSLPTNLTLPFILHLWALPTSFGQQTVPLQVSKVFWQQRVIRSSRRSLWHIMGHDFYYLICFHATASAVCWIRRFRLNWSVFSPLSSCWLCRHGSRMVWPKKNWEPLRHSHVKSDRSSQKHKPHLAEAVGAMRDITFTSFQLYNSMVLTTYLTGP